jgi:hypothetical protein
MKPIRLTEHITTDMITPQEQDDFFVLLMEGYTDRGGTIVVPRQHLAGEEVDFSSELEKFIARRAH